MKRSTAKFVFGVMPLGGLFLAGMGWLGWRGYASALWSVTDLTRWFFVCFLVLNLALFWASRRGYLSFLMGLIYGMPFSCCWGYLINPSDFYWWETPLSKKYMDEPRVMERLLGIGIVGLVALYAGMLMIALIGRLRWGGTTKRQLAQSPLTEPRRRYRLGSLAYFLLCGFALLLSWLNAPAGTIFSDVYSAALGYAQIFNFNGAFLVSYSIVVLLYVDAEIGVIAGKPEPLKYISLAATVMIILVFLQFLKGDRESLGLILGMVVLYLTRRQGPRRASESKLGRWLKKWMMVGGAISVVVGFLILQFVRVSAATDIKDVRSAVHVVAEGYAKESIWGAILLTNLSQSAGFENGRFDYEHGATYRDYALSLPPGFVTAQLNLTRPIERDNGPQFWYMDVSAGGIHIVCVPYQNFGIAGVAVLLTVIGVLIGISDWLGQRDSWFGRLQYGCAFVLSFHWFWYGDIIAIREVMAFVAIAFMYVALRRRLS